MTPDKQDCNDPDPAPCDNGAPANLEAHCECLELKVKQLEKELERQAQVLAMIQEERDQLREIVYPPLWQKFSEEELRRFAEDDNLEDTQELHEFIGEIEDIVNGKKRP